jgi:hypothetical protein
VDVERQTPYRPQPTAGEERAGRDLLAVLVAAAGLALWWTWPLARFAATHVALPPGHQVGLPDQHLVTWALSWDAHALATRPWRLFDANAFYPAPDSLAYSDHFLGCLPLFAPTWWLTGNPLLAGNLLVLLTYPLCTAAMYALARRWVARPAALLAGLLYGFSAWHHETLTHFYLLNAQYFPLVLLFTERWLDTARAREAVLLAASLLLQMLTTIYFAYAALLLYTPWLGLALWRRRAALDRRRLGGLAVSLAAVSVGFGLSLLPYLHMAALGLLPSYGAPTRPLPFTLDAIGAGALGRRYLATVAGPVGWALALGGLALGWRRHRWAWATAAVAVAVGGTLMWGPRILLGGRLVWTPYQALVEAAPGFATLRVPMRFGQVALLGLALFAALAADALLARVPRRLRALAGLGLGVALLATMRPPPLVAHAIPVGDGIPPAYRWLGAHGAGRALLELPRPSPAVAAQRMYFSTAHWLPVVDGYSGYPAETANFLHELAAGLPGETALQSLVDHVDVGWILVHEADLPPERRAAWEGPLPAGLDAVQAWDGDRLFRVTRPTREDRRERLLDGSRTLGNVPLRPLRQCAGELRLVAAPEGSWAPGDVPLEVEVLNRSGRPWPGDGLVPRHLVRLVACLKDPEAPGPCAAEPVPLPDVPPQGAVRARVSVAAAAPGDFVLEVFLFQVGDGPLARCGLPPLRRPVRVAAAADAPPAARR